MQKKQKWVLFMKHCVIKPWTHGDLFCHSGHLARQYLGP